MAWPTESREKGRRACDHATYLHSTPLLLAEALEHPAEKPHQHKNAVAREFGLFLSEHILANVVRVLAGPFPELRGNCPVNGVVPWLKFRLCANR